MSAAYSRHITLTAGVVSHLEIVDGAYPWNQGSARLRIINRTGTDEVFVNISVDKDNEAVAPALEMSDTYILPATISEEFIPLEGVQHYLSVKLIAPTTNCDVSVIIDSKHWGPGIYR